MTDYTHKGVIELLRQAQEVEKDRREKVREVHTFLNEPDGQWEPEVYNNFSGRPRYTFDKCNDLVDDIAGEMEQADFDIRVRPAGGDASKDTAKTYDGMIRNIENMSNAVDVFNGSGRKMIAAGFDAWRVSQRWGDNNTFDQELFIDTVADAVDRVWFDHNSVLQTREDAEYCFVLQSMSRAKYEEKFPDGSGMSVGDNSEKYEGRKPDVITVGEFIYKQKVKKRIVELTNGSVFIDDENFRKVQDEYSERGVDIKRERMREMDEVKTRLFDGKDWLTKVQDTVFEYLPIIPTYGNWSVSQSVPNYWGIVTHKLDAQRVYNYSRSRAVEEGALAPLDKIMATSTQVGAHKETWQNMNTSSDPVLLYEPDEEADSPPYKIGGPQINAGLEASAAAAAENLQSTAGLDQLNGQPVGLQSGVAVELKQNKGDTRNFKYTASQERAICHTAKVLVRAIPKVYDTQRQVRIIGEDGAEEIITLNERVYDEESGQHVVLNDLAKGLYDVVCEVGPAFKNRQSETVHAFNEMGERDPSIIEAGKDIWVKNLNAPGMDVVAERIRRSMVLSGSIPEEQLTDEEKELLANIEPKPDPIADALQREMDIKEDEVELKGIEQARKDRELQHKIDMDSMSEAMEQLKVAADTLNKQVETLNQLKEFLGVDAIISPNGINLLQEQARQVREAQAEQP